MSLLSILTLFVLCRLGASFMYNFSETCDEGIGQIFINRSEVIQLIMRPYVAGYNCSVQITLNSINSLFLNVLMLKLPTIEGACVDYIAIEIPAVEFHHPATYSRHCDDKTLPNGKFNLESNTVTLELVSSRNETEAASQFGFIILAGEMKSEEPATGKSVVFPWTALSVILTLIVGFAICNYHVQRFLVPLMFRRRVAPAEQSREEIAMENLSLRSWELPRSDIGVVSPRLDRSDQPPRPHTR